MILMRKSFFKRKEKTKEQRKAEQRVMEIHQNATYMTYIDEWEWQGETLHFQGPHSVGNLQEGTCVLMLDCNGNTLGRYEIARVELHEQKRLEGSLYTGQYAELYGKLKQGDQTFVARVSMLVNEDIFAKEN